VTVVAQTRDPSPAGGHDRIIQSNGKEDLSSHVHRLLPLESSLDFFLNPLALNRVLGEDKDQFVMSVNGLVNFVAVVVAWHELMGSEPAGNVLFAEICV
jgi:hypothetical protein